MGAVVSGTRESFTASTEVCIVADCALIAVTNDVRVLLRTTFTITVDTDVLLLTTWYTAEMLVEGNKRMTWVCLSSILLAVRAIIPVRAVEALVTDAVDILEILAYNQPTGPGLDLPSRSRRKWPSGVCYGQQAEGLYRPGSGQWHLKQVQVHDLGDGRASC